MNDRVKQAAEMFALGGIQLSQVAEIIEKEYPFYKQTLMMMEAMIHAEKTYNDYLASMKL